MHTCVILLNAYMILLNILLNAYMCDSVKCIHVILLMHTGVILLNAYTCDSVKCIHGILLNAYMCEAVECKMHTCA